jgi:hypothetical protein
VNANVLQGEVDHNGRERFGVTRDGENLVIRHRVRVIAEQFPAPRNRDQFGFLFRTIEYIHGAPPLERESRRFVLCWVRAQAHRPEAGAPMYVERRCERSAASDMRDVKSTQ